MEKKNRTLWIVLAVVAALAVLCCCLVAAAGALLVPISMRGGVPEGANWRWGFQAPGLDITERIEKTFEVGSDPALRVDNFAGEVTIRAGGSGVVRVVATKRIRRAGNLDAIVVEMSGAEITTSHPTLPNISNATVKLEITVPADTVLDLHTGAGAIDVRDVQGDLRVDAGAGSVVIRGAAGLVNVTNGAGSIDYDGNPTGLCTFHAGAGSITLRLPANANVIVNLNAGVGGVHSDLPVDGAVTRRTISGAIGTGSAANITASAGVGSIDLLRR